MSRVIVNFTFHLRHRVAILRLVLLLILQRLALLGHEDPRAVDAAAVGNVAHVGAALPVYGTAIGLLAEEDRERLVRVDRPAASSRGVSNVVFKWVFHGFPFRMRAT